MEGDACERNQDDLTNKNNANNKEEKRIISNSWKNVDFIAESVKIR